MGRGGAVNSRSDGGRARLCDLKTRRSAFGASKEPASVAFGGTTLYSQSQTVLDSLIGRIQDEILCATTNHLILPRPALGKVVHDALGEEVDKPVFGAIVGRLLSIGQLEGVPCLTVHSRVFTVVANADRIPELSNHLTRIEDFLRKRGTVSTREVQGLCFPDRGWGTYIAASSILGHLAYIGRAVFVASELFAWPKEVENALCKGLH
jgi:hypothetical protein